MSRARLFALLRRLCKLTAMACAFAGDYHDTIWGVPVRDSRTLFAQLSLCTQQCGVSAHRLEQAPPLRGGLPRLGLPQVAQMTAEDVDALCDKSGPWAGKLSKTGRSSPRS